MALLQAEKYPQTNIQKTSPILFCPCTTATSQPYRTRPVRKLLLRGSSDLSRNVPKNAVREKVRRTAGGTVRWPAARRDTALDRATILQQGAHPLEILIAFSETIL